MMTMMREIYIYIIKYDIDGRSDDHDGIHYDGNADDGDALILILKMVMIMAIMMMVMLMMIIIRITMLKQNMQYVLYKCMCSCTVKKTSQQCQTCCT